MGFSNSKNRQSWLSASHLRAGEEFASQWATQFREWEEGTGDARGASRQWRARQPPRQRERFSVSVPGERGAGGYWERLAEEQGWLHLVCELSVDEMGL